MRSLIFSRSPRLRGKNRSIEASEKLSDKTLRTPGLRRAFSASPAAGFCETAPRTLAWQELPRLCLSRAYHMLGPTMDDAYGKHMRSLWEAYELLIA